MSGVYEDKDPWKLNNLNRFDLYRMIRKLRQDVLKLKKGEDLILSDGPMKVSVIASKVNVSKTFCNQI